LNYKQFGSIEKKSLFLSAVKMQNCVNLKIKENRSFLLSLIKYNRKKEEQFYNKTAEKVIPSSYASLLDFEPNM
jgi:hypothetical protein